MSPALVISRREMRSMDPSKIDGRIREIGQRCGLSDVAGKLVGELSKGFRQRVGLAQAMLHDPDIVILDEPTSGLDPEGRRLVLDIIAEEKKKGRTVFLSSHILSDVERTCDEVVMVNHGEVAFSHQMAAFHPGGDDWEIEVTGWNAAHRELLADLAFSVATEAEDSAVLVCAAGQKKALLNRLTSLPMDVGTVQRRRGASLEETYLKHVGKA